MVDRFVGARAYPAVDGPHLEVDGALGWIF
jgi:hypothetical protein